MKHHIAELYSTFREQAIRWARSRLGRFGEQVTLYLFLLPDIVRLFLDLLSDTRVFLFDKLFLILVLIYIISPFDLIPEILAGPFGIVEDVLIALLLLSRFLGNPLNNDAIWDHWKGDRPMMFAIQAKCQTLRRFFQRMRL